MTPNQRSVVRLRGLGYDPIETVEHRIRGRRSKDLWGGDVLAIRSARPVGPRMHSWFVGETLLVQATSDNGGNVAARVRKLIGLPSTARLLAAGWQIEVHGWEGDQVRIVSILLLNGVVQAPGIKLRD